MNKFKFDGDWGLGMGDWGWGIGPNPQSPIPNPQSPIPILLIKFEFIHIIYLIKFYIIYILFYLTNSFILSVKANCTSIN